MTVKELIAELSHLPQDFEVHIGYNYGDYWRTEVRPAARVVEMENVIHSGYHNMDKVADEDRADLDPENVREVVVIR